MVLVLNTVNCTLSFSVTAKPGIAKDFIEADDIDRKDVADFIDSLKVENLDNPHIILQANKFF